jgi:hypothetical protein
VATVGTEQVENNPIIIEGFFRNHNKQVFFFQRQFLFFRWAIEVQKNKQNIQVQDISS